MKPLYDALSFLQALCKAARSGTFQPNLGLNVLARRRERDPRLLDTQVKPTRKRRSVRARSSEHSERRLPGNGLLKYGTHWAQTRVLKNTMLRMKVNLNRGMPGA